MSDYGEKTGTPTGIYTREEAQARAERFGLRITPRGEPIDHTAATEAAERVWNGEGDIPGIGEEVEAAQAELGVAGEPFPDHVSLGRIIDAITRATAHAAQVVAANEHLMRPPSIEEVHEQTLRDLMYSDEGYSEEELDSRALAEAISDVPLACPAPLGGDGSPRKTRATPRSRRSRQPIPFQSDSTAGAGCLSRALGFYEG